MSYIFFLVGRDSSVSIAMRYGLDVPGIRCRWGTRFSAPLQATLGPTQPPVQWVSSLFLGGKAAAIGIDHPHLSSAEFEERGEQLHLCPLSVPSWPLLG